VVGQLPQLMQFYDEHAAQRDKFEIVAFCVDHDGEMKSVADLYRHLKPIIENDAWNGRQQLPFPLLLDASLRTCKSFGIDGISVEVLIDPQGRLVQGDVKTLAEKLKEP
jgi:hypothetical protein